MKTVWFFGSSYIIPNSDNVVLGGTAQRGDWNTTVSIADTERILGNIGELFPSLAKAPIVSTPLDLAKDSTNNILMYYVFLDSSCRKTYG